ncbi:MAG: hypothetical protein GAK40_00901 [Burkholderia plantarii]|nr:MAG: hypothetical protein GAK40_00901 [Burkholderia plantarii]
MRQTIKALLAALAAALLCAACAPGGGGSDAGSGHGSIEMYGTIDQGITVRR